MTDIQNNRLSMLVGKTVTYKGKEHFIQRYKSISTGKICVFTHLETLNFFPSEIEAFLENVSEPKEKDFRSMQLVSPVSLALSSYQPSAENVELKASLMEMLAKVKTNPEVIPQAKAVIDIANAVVNIQKTELEMIKLTNKM